MEDEGDQEFTSEQVNDVVKNAITKNLGSHQYNKEKVNAWTASVIDDTLKELAKMQKPFKYVVTCIVMQKSGAPMHTGLAVCWDTKTDGMVSVQVGLDTMDCVTAVYACMI